MPKPAEGRRRRGFLDHRHLAAADPHPIDAIGRLNVTETDPRDQVPSRDQMRPGIAAGRFADRIKPETEGPGQGSQGGQDIGLGLIGLVKHVATPVLNPPHPYRKG